MNFKMPTPKSVLDMLRSGDIALAVRCDGADPHPDRAAAGTAGRRSACHLDRLLGHDSDDGAVHQKPLEFSSFPTVLLIATMLRLGMNLATTRLILSEGHNGTHAAGHVIEAFGNFVTRGNFVIGTVISIILVIVNFIVITKGSGRIAEVAGAFQLGRHARQADGHRRRPLAGLIDEDTAKKAPRRTRGRKRFLR